MRTRHEGGTGVVAGCVFEALEGRRLLASALPTIDQLSNPDNTVVRFETTAGSIDIEMYDRGAPNGASAALTTVENFLFYLREGTYDLNFFHRAVDDIEFAVLQGGGFKFTNAGGVTAVPTPQRVANEFDARRGNTERTIAMAKLGGDPDSASSQFFFNVIDNSQNLNSQNGGFTVFGRVIQGWDNVLEIVGSSIVDLRASNLLNNAAMGEVPVTSNYRLPDRPQEEDLNFIIDAEVVKPRDAETFFVHRLFYPEGFAGSTINEFLPIVNPNNTTVDYQVVVRYETGDRDEVIDHGSIAANTRGGLTISRFSQPQNSKVRIGVPYAIEVHSTAPLAASLSHFDFGTATGEAFAPGTFPIIDGGYTSTRWGFGEGFKSPGDVLDFIVWQNLTEQPATVTLTFYRETTPGGVSHTVTLVTPPYRRGGVSISEIEAIPNGPVATLVTSDRPIVAALSHYERGNGNGFGTLGVPGTGGSVGVLPQGNIGATDDVRQYFTALYPRTSPTDPFTLVNLDMSFTDPNRPLQERSFRLDPDNRGGFDFTGLPEFNDGAGFSIRYDTLQSRRLYAHGAHYEFGDAIGLPVGTTAAASWHFADGFMDPSRAGQEVFSTVSFYNPYSALPNTVTLRIRFDDGSAPLERTFTLAPRGRLDVALHEFQPLLDDITANEHFFFSLEVAAESGRMVVAQYSLYDVPQGGGFGTLGTPIGLSAPLSSQVFNG